MSATRCVLGISLVMLLTMGAAGTQDAGKAAERAAAWFESHSDRPTMLRAFLHRMPKGGDIHTHLSGAVYAESYIDWAEKDGLCLATATDVLVAPPCHPGDQPVAEALSSSQAYELFIDRLSVRNVSLSNRSGHDQFFSTFAAFGAISSRHDDMLAEVSSRAASQHIFYMETMLSVPSAGLREALDGAQTQGAFGDGWQEDLAGSHAALLDNGLARAVTASSNALDTMEQGTRQLMACDGESSKADPGCEVTVRYLQQAIRTAPPEQVFAQLVHGFALARADGRVVGVNLVAPEDDRVSLRDYRLHMQMLEFLAGQYPDVGIALHAGELTLGLVPPAHLRFHIREAIETGRAQRIGHGVDIDFENDALELMDMLREQDVLVEILLTSNDVILGVTGNEHPFPDYLEAGVPVTLATDDEGVSRIDLTNEYLRAATTYGLGYEDLKTLARNSLTYSFLAGNSLWSSARLFTPIEACADDTLGSASPSLECRQFLAGSDRAREQWRLEAERAEFERLPWLK